MSKYEEMIDKEINVNLGLAILKSKNPKAKSIEFDDAQGCYWVNTDGFASYKYIDFCNNWADMGPLIAELDISLISQEYNQDDDGIWHASTSACCKEDDDLRQCFCARSENPLRAAAIVYLMIKDAE